MSAKDESSRTPVIHALHGRRRRSFLAERQEETLDIDTVPANGEEDDIPVLTEVVTPESPVEQPPPEPVEAPEADPMIAVEARIEELATDMARAIAEQMAYELPTLIEATLLNAGTELRNGITATMETALREYIARRKQLSLPLDGAEGLKDPANDGR